MNCRSAESLFSSHIEDEISQEERRHLEAHLMGCRRCSVALREMRATMSMLQRDMPLVQPGAHFDEDLFAKIRSGEGLRPSAWDVIREVLAPIRLRPLVAAGAGAGAMALALLVSPVGQGVLHSTFARSSARPVPVTNPMNVASNPSVPEAASPEIASTTGPRATSPARSGALVASAAPSGSAVQDSILDGGASPAPRYDDEIINDQFYLDRGAPTGQDPSVVPVNTSRDDGVYIVF